MPSIYVIDTETTGLDGYFAGDLVVDIGICEVKIESGTVIDVYSSVVGYDISAWTEEQKHSWIFENTDLTVEAVAGAPSMKDVVASVSEILSGKKVTSYNVGFDFDKFLNFPLWELRKISTIAPDIMLVAANYCKIPGYYDQYKWPKLTEAYSALVPGDLAGINGKQDHRALSDARMASYVMLALYEKGLYSPEGL